MLPFLNIQYLYLQPFFILSYFYFIAIPGSVRLLDTPAHIQSIGLG